MPTTRTRLAVACVLAAGLGGLISLRPSPAAAPGGDKLNALLAERLATLREVVKLTEANYNAGSGSRDKVIEARFAVLAAELDMCETGPDRVKVLERVVAETKQLEAEAEELVRGRVAPQTTALAAKARRLDAEIKLERARGVK